jgi:uncharacterized protein (UPF0548 family)
MAWVEDFSYAEVGATRDPGALPPPGFHLLRVRFRLGEGRYVLTAAGQAVLDWRMHRAAGLTVYPGAPEARSGVAVVLGLEAGPWKLRAPCRVVWTVQEEQRIGFAYGTLTGHPECGEESFVVERDPDGSVWLNVTAFSRSAAWYTRAAGPLGRVAQHAVARRYGRGLRRLIAREPAERGG